jgi:hypothetical protein
MDTMGSKMFKIDRALGGPSIGSIEGPPSALSMLVITMACNSIQHDTCYDDMLAHVLFFAKGLPALSQRTSGDGT